MTTNPTPSVPAGPGQPSWGTPSAPPAGSGSDSAGGSGSTATAPSGPPAARFFDQVRSLGVVRPDEGRRAAGVAAGLARRWGVDPGLVRLGLVVLAFLGGLGVALYGLGWLLLPQADGRIHAQQALAGSVTAGFVGAVLLLLCTLHVDGPLLPLALVALLAWKLGTRHPRPVA